MATVLLVGNATLDLIYAVTAFPGEDSEVRAVHHRRAPGGNAANSARVLALLGHRVQLATTLADDAHGRDVARELAHAGVDLGGVRWLDGATPTSAILLSEAAGTRTIVHHRDLDEYPIEAFAALALGTVDWLHFEGRQPEITAAMIARAAQTRVDQPISVEIEKDRPGIERVLAGADLVILARAFARARGWSQPKSGLRWARGMTRARFIAVAWGAEGAVALDDDELVQAAPPAPGPIVDTNGAGDTFNAGLIDALASGRPLDLALDAAVSLATAKCRAHGFDHLANARGR